MYPGMERFQRPAFHNDFALNFILTTVLVTMNVNGLQVLPGQFGGRTGREPAETS